MVVVYQEPFRPPPAPPMFELGATRVLCLRVEGPSKRECRCIIPYVFYKRKSCKMLNLDLQAHLYTAIMPCS